MDNATIWSRPGPRVVGDSLTENQKHMDKTLSASMLYTDSRSGGLHVRRFRLTVVCGPDATKSLLLEEGTALVGTAPGCDLVLTDRAVSRHHLELQVRPDGLHVIDAGSTNGTFAGEVRIGTVVLTGAARLRLGPHTELEVTPADVPVEVGLYPAEQFGAALGRSRVMRELFGLLDRVARSDATLLLLGETGTGKEALAEAVHQVSPRRGGPFVVVDCGALPKNLIGSELFGHVRGAFTGATENKRGLIEEADRGTLFLDEIGELPLELQPQLLRVLEKREVRPIGETRSRKVNIRVIAATNRDMQEMLRSGQFREDLYFRLAVVQAQVPPLRQRKEDIPLLVAHFLRQMGKPQLTLSDEVMAQLQAHDWPGNVRELRNVVESGLSLGSYGALPRPVSPQGQPEPSGDQEPRDLQSEMRDRPFKEAKGLLIEQFERDYLTHLLRRHAGNISRAAQEAGIDRNYIHRLVKKYGIPTGR